MLAISSRKKLSIKPQLMQKMEAQWRRRFVKPQTAVCPRGTSRLSLGEQRKSRYQIKGRRSLRRLNANLLRGQIGTRAFAFQLAVARPLTRLRRSRMLLMLAARSRHCSHFPCAVLHAVVRMVPAAAKHRMDE
jgi:hypothetical protein